MTENEAEVLRELQPYKGETEAPWLTPLRFGGTGNSHHAQTAKRMITKGWTERRHRNGDGPTMARGSYEYRITPKGLEALGNHNAIHELAKAKRP